MREMLAQVAEKTEEFDWREYSLRRLQSFDRAERTAIIHYLEFQAKDEYAAVEINQALEVYWRSSVQTSVI